MHKNDDDYYDRQTELLEKFLSKNDKLAFQKMLNMNIISPLEKEKDQFRRRSNLLKSMKTKPSVHYYEQFHMHKNYPNYNNYNANNTELFNINYNNNFQDNQISNFRLDFHNIFQDPDYKDKCMKGNYKWGSMKFQQIKQNLAKRRGVSIDNLQMPKVAERRRNNMEMNGHLVMDNNPLSKSVKFQRKNTVNAISHSYRNKIGKINNQDISVKRHLTEKDIPSVRSKELNIEI